MPTTWRYRLNLLPDLDEVAKAPMLFYGAVTCWWSTTLPYTVALPGVSVTLAGDKTREPGLPCDPRGGVLFQTDDAAGFIGKARALADHYGEHGIDAFRAAYHGAVEIWAPDKAAWLPTCFVTWRAYNQAITAARLMRERGGTDGTFEMEAGPVDRAVRERRP